MAYVVRTDPATCTGLGRPGLGHIPLIWSNRWACEIEASDYLIARGTGRWVNRAIVTDYAEFKPLSANSALALGYDLACFIEWRDAHKLSMPQIMHPEVPGHYSEDMELGRWSRNNTRHSLSSSTVQRRAGVCSDFLAYLSSCCGLEEMDSASYYLKRSLSAVTDTSTALGSPRAVRRHPRDLRLPTLQELKAWLDHLREARGPVAYYMGKTAVEVGLRADEIIHLREDQLPPLPLDGQKQAKMPIRYGTKGLRKPQDPAKTGKERSVYIPTEFLVELHRFKDTTRKAMVHRLKNKSDDWKEPNELFFSEKTGKNTRINASMKSGKACRFHFQNIPHTSPVMLGHVTR